MNRWASWATLIGAFGVLAGLAVYDDVRTSADRSFYSSYDSGPRGYRALYETLEGAKVPVRRFERDIASLDADIQTLVISSSELERESGASDHPIDQRDAQRLARFVERGGRLVLLDDSPTYALTPFHLNGRHIDAAAATFRPTIRLPFLTGVETLHAPTTRLYAYGARNVVPLFGTPLGAVAVLAARGKGVVVAILAPELFSNATIDRADNARFAFALLGNGAPVAFDERVHGYTVDRTFWDALPLPVHVALWLAIVIGALLLVDANVRFTPVVSVEAPTDRDSSAYLSSMASLLRRSHAAHMGIARFAEDCAQRVGSRANLPAHVRAAADELALLARLDRPDDAALVRAARLSASIRKDLA